MLKKTIPYHDLDDNPVEDTFWFHMSKAELAEMALGKEGNEGGFESWVKRLISSNNGEEIVATFKKILLATVGERSADNKSFIKTDEIRQRFEGSEAYSILFMDLLTDHNKMSEFINGVMPKAMRDQVMAQTKEVAPAQDSPPATTTGVTTDIRPALNEKDDRPDWIKDPTRVPTESELRGATPEQMMEAFRRKSAGSGPVTQEQIPPQ